MNTAIATLIAAQSARMLSQSLECAGRGLCAQRGQRAGDNSILFAAVCNVAGGRQHNFENRRHHLFRVDQGAQFAKRRDTFVAQIVSAELDLDQRIVARPVLQNRNALKTRSAVWTDFVRQFGRVSFGDTAPNKFAADA